MEGSNLASIIGYVIVGLIAVIFLLSLFIGYKRGFKKSLFRFCWLLVTAGLLLLITPAISSWLNTYDISSFGLNIAGPVNKLSDIGLNLMNEFGLTEYMAESPALAEFAQNLTTMLLNIFLYVILFWLCKLILGIPYLIIAKKCFDKDATERKKYEKKVNKLKDQGAAIEGTEEEIPLVLTHTNKLNGLGMLFGALVGFLLCVVTLSPIVGLNTVYQAANASVTVKNEEGEQIPYLSTIVDGEILGYMNCYNDSIASKIMTYTGMEFTSNFVFDKMATVTVNNESVSLSQEIKTGLTVYKRVSSITGIIDNIKTASKDDIAETLTQVKEIFFDIEDSKALYVIGDELAPYFIEKYFINDADIKLMIGDTDYMDTVRTAYNNYVDNNNLTMKSLKTQLESIVDVATLLNNNGLVSPLLSGQVTKINDIISLLSTNVLNPATFSETLVNNLYNVSLLKDEYPRLVDDLLKGVFEAIDITFESNRTNMTSTNVKSSLKVCVENALKMFKGYNSSTKLDFGTDAQTEVVFASVGKVIDSASANLISSSSYNSLLNYIKTLAKDNTRDFANFDSIIDDSITNSLTWETELRLLAPLYNVIIDINNDDPTAEGAKYDKLFVIDNILTESFEQLDDIGVALQSVVSSNNSKIINNKNLRDIFSILLDKVATNDDLKAYLDDVVLDDDNNASTPDKSVRTILLNNIWDSTKLAGQESSIVSWTNELNYSLDVIRKLNTTLVDYDKTRISGVDNTELKDLGKALDLALANTNLFMSSQVLRELVNYFITDRITNSPSFPVELENILIDPDYYNGTDNVLTKMLNNIYSVISHESVVTSWEEELSSFKALFASSFSGTGSAKYVAIGKALDGLATSKILSRTIVKSIVTHYIDVESATFTTNDPDLLAEGGPIRIIKNIISQDSKVKDGNGQDTDEYAIKYEVEIKKLVDLVAVVSSTYGTERLKYNAIGDAFTDLLQPANASCLLPKSVLNSFLSYYITHTTGLSTALNEIVSDIPTNTIPGTSGDKYIDAITNYKQEFNLMLDIVDLLRDSSSTLVEIGEKFDYVTLNNSHLITQATINDMIVYYIDNNVAASVDNTYSSLITQIKANINRTTTWVSNLYRDLFTELSSLKTSFDVMVGFDDLDDFKKNINTPGDNNLGTFMDGIRAMTLAGDYIVARMVAVILVDNIKEYAGKMAVKNDLSRAYGEEMVTNITEGTTYKFSTFDLTATNSGYTGTHSNYATYYSTMIADIAVNVNFD